MTIYAFAGCELDMAVMELRRGGAAVHVEPQVFSLLVLLAQSRGQVVTKDEMIENIWRRRIVSDDVLFSAISMARRALGDDGSTQAIIRTVRGHGVRLMPEVRLVASAYPNRRRGGLAGEPAAKPSLAILPLATAEGARHDRLLSLALTHELIAALSRLSWLTVIDRGTAFRFLSGEAQAGATAAALGMRYELSGTLERTAGQIIIALTVAKSDTGEVIWGERFAGPIDSIHELREEIVRQCCRAIDHGVPAHEAAAAMLLMPEQLDAWQCFHLGLHHLYRFLPEGTAQAMELFERAVAADPRFSRAHAGLSFAHFQNGFMRYSGADLSAARDAARRHAELALEYDPEDSFAHFTMGRSFWLHDDLEQGFVWLERACALNPNFAQAHYAVGWTRMLWSDTAEGAAAIDIAEEVSPLDPLRYGMTGTRAMGALVDGDYAEASRLGALAARSPGAHGLVSLVALVSHDLAGDTAAAEAAGRQARERQPGVNAAHFFTAFPFASESARTKMAGALARHGF